MRGVLYYGNQDVRYSDSVEEPTIQNPIDVKLKVAFCGICGSDLHEYLEGPIFFPSVKRNPDAVDTISGNKLPICPGHEFSGIVEEVGSAVTHLKPGDHVVVEATGHCVDSKRYPKTTRVNSHCAACRKGKPNCCENLGFCGLGVSSGGFAEKVVYGANHVLKIPDSIPLDIAALVEPLSVAWHAVERANFKPGQTALVIGGGPIGLACILALQGHGAGKIVCSEPAKIRREFAANLNAEVFNPFEHKDPIEELKNLVPEDGGFNASFDCSGVQQSFTTSIEALAAGGTAVNVAIWADVKIEYLPMDLTYQEKTATGSMCYTTADFQAVIDALDNKSMDIERVRSLITGKISLEETPVKGYLQLIEHKDVNVKVLVNPNNMDI